MQDRHAPESLDETPGGSGTGRDAGSGDGQGSADLAAIPAFLRDRARTAIVSRVRVPVDGDVPAPALDPASLPMAGVAPRRLVVIGATIVLAWLIVSFSRQVAEASAASSRASELRSANAALAAEVAATERELQLVQEPRYVTQAARAFRLGTSREIPFALEVGAPPLAADAPGSASVRLGGDARSRAPLEAWLDVLFGPDH
jgi:cell division protein FtsB